MDIRAACCRKNEFPPLRLVPKHARAAKSSIQILDTCRDYPPQETPVWKNNGVNFSSKYTLLKWEAPLSVNGQALGNPTLLNWQKEVGSDHSPYRLLGMGPFVFLAIRTEGSEIWSGEEDRMGTRGWGVYCSQMVDFVDL